MSEKKLTTRGVSICAESFGDITHPPLLLIMGARSSMLWWPREFCQMLTAAGYFVIRYDHRDTGLSTVYEAGSIHYTVEDLAEDAAAVIESYGLPSAHIVGASLGGMLAQILALKKTAIVRSLTLLMSGPLACLPEEVLPPTAKSIFDHHAQSQDIDWQNEQQAIDFMVQSQAILIGNRYDFDETFVRGIVRDDYHRSTNLLSMFNHGMLTGGEWTAGQLIQIRVPTLIIQGTEDPVLPFPHAEYLARRIPGAHLIPLEKAGHEIHRQDWGLVIREIQKLTQFMKVGHPQSY